MLCLLQQQRRGFQQRLDMLEELCSRCGGCCQYSFDVRTCGADVCDGFGNEYHVACLIEELEDNTGVSGIDDDGELVSFHLEEGFALLDGFTFLFELLDDQALCRLKTLLGQDDFMCHGQTPVME